MNEKVYIAGIIKRLLDADQPDAQGLTRYPNIRKKISDYVHTLLNDALTEVLIRSYPRMPSDYVVSNLIQICLDLIEDKFQEPDPRRVFKPNQYLIREDDAQSALRFKETIADIVKTFFNQKVEWLSKFEQLPVTDDLKALPEKTLLFMEQDIEAAIPFVNMITDAVVRLNTIQICILGNLKHRVPMDTLIDLMYPELFTSRTLTIKQLDKIGFISNQFVNYCITHDIHSYDYSIAMQLLKKWHQAAQTTFLSQRVERKFKILQKLFEMQELIQLGLKTYYGKGITEQQYQKEMVNIKQAFLFGNPEEYRWRCGSNFTKIKTLAGEINHNLGEFDHSFYTLGVFDQLNADILANFSTEEFKKEQEIFNELRSKNPEIPLHDQMERVKVYEVIASIIKESQNLATFPEKRGTAEVLSQLADNLKTMADEHYHRVYSDYSANNKFAEKQYNQDSIRFRNRLLLEVDRTLENSSITTDYDSLELFATKIKNALLIIFAPALLVKKIMTTTWFFQSQTPTQHCLSELRHTLEESIVSPATVLVNS